MSPTAGHDASTEQIDQAAFQRIGSLVRETGHNASRRRHLQAIVALAALIPLIGLGVPSDSNLHTSPVDGSHSRPLRAGAFRVQQEEHAMASRRLVGVGVVAAAMSGTAVGQNQVLNLDAGGWAQIAHNASQVPGSAITIEFWMNASPTTIGRPISKRPGNSGCYNVEVYGPNAQGNARVTAATFFGTCGNGGSMWTPVGTWVHVAYVCQGGAATRYFLNGVLAEQLAQPPCSIAEGSYPLCFGRTPGFSETQFFGRLDNIRIWSTARTADQLAQYALVQFTPAQAAQSPGLVGSWSFDTGTAADARGVNNGTLESGANITSDNGPGAGADCNANGVLDAYEIAVGALTDSDANGTPDCCEHAPVCLPCPGDTDRNGTVNGVDLASVLAAWATNGSKYPGSDANRDGWVDGGDLAQVLSDWGPCQ